MGNCWVIVGFWNATPPTILPCKTAKVIVWVIVAFLKEKNLFSFLKEATITQTITLAVLHGKMVGGVAFKKPTITQQLPKQLPWLFYILKW